MNTPISTERVDGRRERLDRDVDQQADRVLGVLLERALRTEANQLAQPTLGDGPRGPVDAQQRHPVDDRVTHRPGHDHHRPFPLRDRDESRRVDGLDHRGAAAVRQDLTFGR
jgi:hypothetical protein